MTSRRVYNSVRNATVEVTRMGPIIQQIQSSCATAAEERVRVSRRSVLQEQEHPGTSEANYHRSTNGAEHAIALSLLKRQVFASL